MPIAGLTDRGLAFPQIGVIRKGAPKGEKSPGRDLTYFRVEFDASRPDLKEKFESYYGPQPRRLNVVFPFNDFDRQVSIWYEAYNKGRMVARAGTVAGLDPARNYYLFKADPRTGEVLAKDGYWLSSGEPAEYDKSTPEYTMTYTGKDGKTRQLPVYCKPITRVKLVIRELRELAYFLLRSSSIYDAINISEQLLALWELTGHRWAGVPLIVERKPVQIMCPDENGNRTYREKWLVQFQADPLWSEQKLLGMNAEALRLASGVVDASRAIAALPTGIQADEDDEDEDYIEAEEPDGWEVNAPEVEEADEVIEPQPVVVSGKTNGARPYPPEQLKSHLFEAAEKLPEASAKMISEVAATLEYIYMSKDKRKLFLNWLCGKESLRETDKQLTAALHRWLKPLYQPENAVYVPTDKFAFEEANSALYEYLIQIGQIELPLENGQ